ncbi:RIP metalloprotease RseP [Anaerosporobacter faecicola]|uniref:RIP metalloprotease RseP n=1 Tax=Anaerosporobacter faecicola TaxID=2718714 RepID=UPI00143B30C9|nr:RIP metalloprotease RseP [Anaerosporobacter faecicola]
MNIIIAILIFSLIIIIHELGHFLLAKKNGITVVEFSVGMGPRLISFVKKGTRYSWKLFPVGGSCMMLGEDEENDDPNSFGKKGVWARISVIAAGPIFNFILAFVLSMIVVGKVGYDPAMIVQVGENTPAEEAGLQQGDVIVAMNGSHVDNGREVSFYLFFHPTSEKDVTLTINRDGKEMDITMTPVKNEAGEYKMGFVSNLGRTKTIATTGKSMNAFDVIKYSAIEVKCWIGSAIQSVGGLITGRVSTNDLGGPVAIVDMIGDGIDSTKSEGTTAVLMQIFYMSILLSANLGVMNLLPLPALDGGRLVFLLIEAVRGKPVDPKKEGFVHMVGLMLLMLLMVFVMFNDVRRIFG